MGNRLISHELFTRVCVLANKLHMARLKIEADELGLIFDECDAEFAAEFDRGYELVQEEVREWCEPEGLER